jgi:hypothetical protein
MELRLDNLYHKTISLKFDVGIIILSKILKRLIIIFLRE